MTEEEKRMTDRGNPALPTGEDGMRMLERMNRSHGDVTLWALGFVDFKREDSILDIGCGGGATLSRLLERAPEGHITGVDYSAVAVQTSLKTNEEAVRNKRISVVQGSVEKLPFPSESFNVVTTVESFYFWPSPEKDLSEVFRVLKRNGVFVLVLNQYDSGFLTVEEWKIAKKYGMKLFSREEMSQMLLDQGFRNIRIHIKENGHSIALIASR